jgi:hypothetical protein
MSPRKYPKKAITKHHDDFIKFPEKDNMESFQITMVCVFFASCFLSLTIFNELDLSLFGLFKLLSLFIGVSFFMPISFYRKKFTMSFYEYVIFSCISVGPALLTLMLYLNIGFKSPSYTESYGIESVVHNSSQSVYTLTGNVYEDKEYLRSIGNKDEVVVEGSSNFSIVFSDGLFGIRIIEQKRLH